MANKEVGNLKVSMSLESANVNQSLASVERNIKTVGQELSIIRAKGQDFGDSLEGLKTKNETLGRTLELQEDRVKKLREAYEKSRDEKGKDAKATEDLATKLNKAIAEYTRTEKEIEDVNEALNKQVTDLNQAESKWDKYAGAADQAADKVKAAGDRMKDIGEQATLALTVPITAGLGFAGKIANEFDSAQGRLQAQLGLTEEQAAKLAGTAENLFTNAFGDSIGEVASDLALVKQNMQGIADVDLEKTAERAYILRDAFNAEINESTRTASVLMKNFETDAGTAFDLITTGFQRGGNFSDELLDTLREYAPQFAGMGFTAEEFTATLIAGAEAGAFNLDKVGDAAKEAFLRIGDGSEGSREALGDLGLDFKKIEGDINSGGDSAKAAFAAVTSAIASIEDPAQRAQTAVALLGTPVEDLGPEFQTFFANVNTDLGEFEGATDRAGDALYDNFGTRATEQWRRFTTSLEPAGEILLDLADDILPKVANATEEALEWFEGLDEEGQKTVLAMAGIAAAAGPVLTVFGSMTTGIGGLVSIGGKFAGLLGKAGGAGLLGRIGLMGASAGPVGLAVAGVAGLTLGIVALSDSSKDFIDINYDKINSLEKEVEATDTLIEEYEALAEKNKLTKDEMLRYMDVLYELKEAKTEGAISDLKDEQEKLLEASGLTNEEMEAFLGLNEEIIQQAPNTIQAISDEGFAYADNLDALKELNAEKERELILTTSRELENALSAETELLKEQKELVAEIEEIDAKIQENRQAKKENLEEQTAAEEKIRDLNAEMLELEGESTLEAEVQRTILQEQLNEQTRILEALEQEEEALTNNRDRLTESLIKKNEGLESTREEIRELDRLKDDYEALILAQVGLTAEKGNGLATLREQKEALEEQRDALTKQHEQGKLNTSEYNEQVGKISEQIGKINEAQEELELMNDIAGETIYKDLEVSTTPTIDKINSDLSASVRKPVTIDYSLNSFRQNLPIYGGSMPGFATGTRNAPGGLSMVGEEGPELVYLPTGARVVPTDDTEQLLSKWNIPTSQSAAITSTSVQSPGDTYNFDRMFEGASIQVRSDQDIKQLAKEIHALTQQQKRRAVL